MGAVLSLDTWFSSQVKLPQSKFLSFPNNKVLSFKLSMAFLAQNSKIFHSPPTK